MKTRSAYSYSILRYVHDPSSGEFINIGVALHSKDSRFFDIKIRTTLGRILDVFPDVKSEALRYLLKSLQNRFSKLGEAYFSPLDLESKADQLSKLINSVLPNDDSSLVWSTIGSGISEDPVKTLTYLYERYVTRYDQKKSKVRKTDEDLIRGFRKDLKDRSLSNFFKEKVISTPVDDIKFPFAWKNGIWHCVEPISFDLSAPEYFRDKAHKYLGQITSAHTSSEEFQVYFLVSKPSNNQFVKHFEKAIGILNSLPIKPEIYYDDDKTTLLNKLTQEINEHENHSRSKVLN